jgi:hypothetical protein
LTYFYLLVAALFGSCAADKKTKWSGASRGAVQDSFRALSALLPGAAWPASSPDDGADRHDQAQAVVATETAQVLAVLQRLEHPWHPAAGPVTGPSAAGWCADGPGPELDAPAR